MGYLLKSCQNKKDQIFVGMLQKSYIIKFWEVFKRQLAEFFFSTEALKKSPPKIFCPSCFGRALVSLSQSFVVSLFHWNPKFLLPSVPLHPNIDPLSDLVFRQSLA